MKGMKEIDLETENGLVAHLIDKWLEGWSKKDIDVIMKYVSSDVTAHLPNMLSINGVEELKEFLVLSFILNHWSMYQNLETWHTRLVGMIM